MPLAISTSRYTLYRSSKNAANSNAALVLVVSQGLRKRDVPRRNHLNLWARYAAENLGSMLSLREVMLKRNR